ncbi:MAG: dephospho-CoA kinase [Acidimicrobiales bacterium]
MRLLGLTGGIGSGKSTVSADLAARGAVIIDADAIVKELQQPGQPVFASMVERWGQTIVAPDGTLDRAAVAAIVFSDADELAAIEAIVHPAVQVETARRIAAAADQPGSIVVLDVPLMAETAKKERESGRAPSGSRHKPQAVIVVDCPTELAVDRLVEFRGFDRDDAEARVSRQATREERRELADFVVDNSGDRATLDAELERLWAWVSELSEPTTD